MIPIPNLTDEYLSEQRLIADPPADLVISKILESNLDVRVDQVFYTLVRNDNYNPEHFASFPKEIQLIINNYFESTSVLPSWADPEKITLGQKVFSLYGPEVFLLLNVKSLPMCYSCAKGARVLFDTGRLTERNGKIDPLVRRLMETAQMVVNVLQPGGLEPGGHGIITTQKVRLIHASIRYFLKYEKFNPKGWDVKEMGEPINQEDLAGTLMSFSPIILSGLKQLGIELTKEQVDAYTHCWKVVGHLMGVQEGFLPDTFDEGWTLASRILEHQSAESLEGKALTESCIAFIQYMIPGNLLDDVPEYMIWHFFRDVEEACGKPLAQMIGVEDHKSLKDEFILRLSRVITGDLGKLEHSRVIQKLSSQLNMLLLNGMLQHYNGGKKIHFYIPPSLQNDWGLIDRWQNRRALTPNILGNRLTWQVRKEQTNLN